jgi:hypothetical protein
LLFARVSPECRSLPPAIRFSMSPMEITDAQMPLARGRVVPTAVARRIPYLGDALG